MHVLATAVFSWSLALLIYHFFVYPLAISLLASINGRRKPTAIAQSGASISVIIAAHNEDLHIRRRIENCLAQSIAPMEIIIASDGSTDGTAAVAREFAAPPVIVIDIQPRGGKAAALNRAAETATGDILLFSDARTFFDTAAAEHLLELLQDPQVGAVTGQMVSWPTRPAAEVVSRPLGLFATYEQIASLAETRLASCVSAHGGLLAVRRALWKPIPAGIINDDAYRVLATLKQGYRVAFASNALFFKLSTSGLKDEAERRTRIAAGRYQLLFHPGWWPWSQPLNLFFWMSHKALRLLVPFLLILLFLANVLLLLWPDDDGNYIVPLLAGQLLFYGLALYGLLRPNETRLGYAAKICAMFVSVNFGNLAGLWRFLGGRQKVTWRIVK